MSTRKLIKAGFISSVLSLLFISPLVCAQENLQADDEIPDAGKWVIEEVPLRGKDGSPEKTSMALYGMHQVPEKIVLVPSPASTPNVRNGKLNSFSPWVRAAGILARKGIQVIYLDVPSDAKNRDPLRRQVEMARDLQEASTYLHNRFPAAAISVGSYQSTAIPALNFAKNNGALIDKVIVVSGNFSRARTENWQSLAGRATLIHVPSAKCDVGPFFEAQWVALHSHLRLIQANYAQAETSVSCKRGSQVVLTGLEEPFANATAALLFNQAAPESIGADHAEIAWHEEVLTYEVPSGGPRIEMTLLRPDGEGPFPVVVFNHGDIEMDSVYIRFKQRFRDMVVAKEFLTQGIAVAFPARRGIGMSEGLYQGSASRFDGDPLYSARRHAMDILPAFDVLKHHPAIDASRMLVSGQSAGGYSTMYIASQNIPGVIGAINFSGGRTDNWGNGASYLITTMINGFEEAGKTTNAPMLWIFAEQDSRYPVATINACYDAFTRAGGKATLFISPAIGHDGHYVFHYPDYWRDKLRTYLRQIKL